MTDIAPSTERCVRCGASFQCGALAGSDHCWCFDLPHMKLVEELGSCLCQTCLKQDIESRALDSP